MKWRNGPLDILKTIKASYEEGRLSAIEWRLSVLECQHSSVSYLAYRDDCGLGGMRYEKSCDVCGKILQVYPGWKEWEAEALAELAKTKARLLGAANHPPKKERQKKAK